MLNGRGRIRRALPVVSVVLLAGCGVQGTQFHPGIAAQVGDETITTRHVDQVTDDACQGLEKLSKGSTQPREPTAFGTLTRQVTTALVDQLVAQQLADDYDVTPTSDYKSSLASTEQQLSSLSDDQKAAVSEVVGAQAYVQDILIQIGEIELTKQGQTGSAAQDQFDAGQKVMTAWVADEDVEVNPKYGLDLVAGGPVDTALSVAVGQTAKDGAEAAPSAGYLATLPHNLVCFD